jgi:hypothetical protein
MNLSYQAGLGEREGEGGSTQRFTNGKEQLARS